MRNDGITMVMVMMMVNAGEQAVESAWNELLCFQLLQAGVIICAKPIIKSVDKQDA